MQVWQRNQIFYFLDLVVLKMEELYFLLALKKWNVLEGPVVQLDLLSIGLSLGWATVDDHDVWDLGQLHVNCESISLDVMDVSKSQKVPVPLVLFLLKEFPNQVLVRDKQS